MKGSLIRKAVQLRHQLEPRQVDFDVAQAQTLYDLLHRAKHTAFGKAHGFKAMLQSSELTESFANAVSLRSYKEMREHWWNRALKGESNVTWPGRANFFAKSSGTTDAASKLIPVTSEMISSVRHVGRRQLFSLADSHLPSSLFGKKVLMLGSTTHLEKHGQHFEGDMSGISARHLPWWLSTLSYAPGHAISQMPHWADRINAIVENAFRWDVGIVCGVPSWVQILFEELIAHYRVNHVHAVWPNLQLYIHGGVAFEPYAKRFNQLLDRPITYMETYMASEGSFGFRRFGDAGIQLEPDAGVYFEFIPFNSANFDSEGNCLPQASPVPFEALEVGRDYALVISTCAGAWRYLIGDVIRFTDVQRAQIWITGRTRHFLNVCGEHLSIDNLNQAVRLVSERTGQSFGEFAAAIVPNGSRYAMTWFMGGAANVESAKVAALLEETLCELNDDYRVERSAAIQQVNVQWVPNELFMEFLQSQKAINPMSKFPRVLKGTTLEQWQSFLQGRFQQAEKA